ncbi:NAD-dependent epimerase/dehydratase family protein [Deinococcus yavapaiensis]|uniref:UDP-glucose 4-epimerase n=1 Tax=Deinococcus yavapaiensis KR-236 TaxID=694435 RepID=A0A318SDX3_9DEIO|nr:NAD-dependent epimerase/dehydratase family protein [Deinococcus yavapaiensis]PYE55738.1 UDP-glucose 4-epimerase [Deinococcus yavapaiensis KR-236]
MRFLITGGAGFIGSHIVEHALKRGLTVAVLDDLSEGRREFVPEGVPFFQVDVRDDAAVRAVFEDFRPDVVSHQAAQASVSVSVRDPLHDASVNVMGGLTILRAAVDARVSRVLFASSGGTVYGEVAPGTAAREDDPKLPISPYATSKLAFELYLETFRVQYGLSYTVLRYGNVYGPRQNPHGEAGVTAIFARLLLSGEPVRVNAARDGDAAGCVRDYVYVEDVAAVNVAAALAELGEDAVFNVGTGEGRTTLDVATALAGALGVPLDVRRGDYRAGDLQRCVLDVGRLREAWRAPTPFEEGMARTADWFREHDR